MKRAVSYQDVLIEHLKDPEEAAAYLTACFEEGPEIFLQGLGHVVEAQGRVRRTARLSRVNRESLYRLVSKDGNLRLSTLDAVLKTLRFTVHFAPA